MILTDAKNEVTIQGQFKTSGFSIHASPKAFQILSSNIYTHKVRAVIREYSTNAADAHIEAGINRPFEVHLPTLLEPWFSVRDFGAGLCPEDVRGIFATYFYSTKTNSNSTTGCMGLGSCSAYSLVDSFLVTSFHEGTKSTYSCYKDEDGVPQIALLAEDQTDEVGLSIQVDIPQSKIREFETEAVEVYQYFDRLPSINKDISPLIESARSDYNLIEPDFAIGEKYGTFKAVMGNVAYTIPSELSLGCKGWAKFNLGDLSFDPGRENLSLDERTKNKVKERLEEIKGKLIQTVLDRVETEPTIYKKRLVFNKLKTGYVGKVLVGRTEFKELEWPNLKNSVKSFTLGKKIDVNFHVPYFDQSSEYIFRSDKKSERKLKIWMKQNDVRKVFILSDEAIAESEIDPDVIRNISDLVLTKSARSTSERVKVKKYTCGWSNSSVDITQPYVYVELFNGKPSQYANIQYIIRGCEKLGIKFDLYGMTQATKKRGAGVELSEYLAKVLPEEIKEIEIPEEYWLSKIDDRFDAEDTDYQILAAMRAGKRSIIKDTSLMSLRDRYFKKYPMLKLLKNVDDEQMKIVLAYAKKLE
jgi:hypothetical protein